MPQEYVYMYTPMIICTGWSILNSIEIVFDFLFAQWMQHIEKCLKHFPFFVILYIILLIGFAFRYYLFAFAITMYVNWILNEAIANVREDTLRTRNIRMTDVEKEVLKQLNSYRFTMHALCSLLTFRKHNRKRNRFVSYDVIIIIGWSVGRSVIVK